MHVASGPRAALWVLLSLTTAAADVSGRWSVRDVGAPNPSGVATIDPAGAGLRRLTLTRPGEPDLQADGRLVGDVWIAPIETAAAGITGALAGGPAPSRVWLTLSPASDGALRGLWWDPGSWRILREQRWSPLAAPTPAVTALTFEDARPDEAAFQRLLAAALRDDGVLDADEARDLATFAKAASGRNQRVVALLDQLAAAGSAGGVGSLAAPVLRAAARGERRGDVPLDNAVYRVIPGPSPFLEDDALILTGLGAVEAETGLRSHSRGYAAKSAGVLFTRHGSRAPHHPATSTATETAALRTQGPDAALDQAAAVAGVRLSPFTTFAATARSAAFYDPSAATPYWAGICQGWTHNALDDRLNLLVDPPGEEGARGLWIFGQWISRADLGNALMGASYSLGLADSVTIDSLVTPPKLIKALAQHVLRSGVGLRADLWGDAHNPTGGYDYQVWNQPIVGARIRVAAVSVGVANAVLAHAAQDPRLAAGLPAGATVRWVHAQARWGAETDDAWEGEPAFRTSDWQLYLVADASGRVLTGYMAYDLVAAGIGGLPATQSDGLPDYMALPRHALTDAALGGDDHWLLDPSNAEGQRFRFLVGTVLARGIPEPTRAAFEAEALAPGADRDRLRARYPGIANAYSPAQWRRVFEPILGPGAAFGAVWAP